MLFELRDGKGRVLSPDINSSFAVGRSGRTVVGLACTEKNSSC